MQRRSLNKINLPTQLVDAVEVHEITMAPGEVGKLHVHPCPVTGYIAEGVAVMQIDGKERQIMEAGTSFYEPANVHIREFGNYSSEQPMKFIAFYLLNGRQELIKML